MTTEPESNPPKGEEPAPEEAEAATPAADAAGAAPEQSTSEQSTSEQSTSEPAPSEEVPKEEPKPVAAAAPALSEDQLSGRLFRRWNGGAFVLGVLVLVGAAFMTRGGSPAPSAAPSSRFDPLRFTSDARWDQGRAEVARYAARRVIYSQPQTYELIRVAVKERFDPAQGVKGEAPGSLDAIKTIAIHDTPTHRPYRYRQQVMVQVPRLDPRQVLAASMSSQEWCGATFVRLLAEGGAKRLSRTIHSYWSGEADRRDQLPPGLVLADQVPFLVRAVHWQRTPKLELELLPTLLSNRGPQRAPIAATLERVGEEELSVPAGTFACVHVRVLRATEVGEAVDHYWVGKGEGRPLVKFQDATGQGELSALEWQAYWEDPSGSPTKGEQPAKRGGQK